MALHARSDGRGDVLVEEGQQRVASVDEVHLDAERGEGAGVFGADHARADHRQARGQLDDLEDLVGVVDARMR